MNTEWYKNFFYGIALELWSKAISEEQTKAETDFLEASFDLPPGSRILDVPCGNGRHSLELAKRGYEMVGVDLANDFVQDAQTRSAAAGLRIEWRLGDMRNLPWKSHFDGAFCFGNSFGYLDHRGTLDFLKALSKVLKPTAKFVLESPIVAESILPNLKKRDWYQIEDIHFLIENHYNCEESRIETAYTFLRDGVCDVRHGSQQVYTSAEVRRLLKEVGLVPIAQYSSLSREAFKAGCPQFFVVSRKVNSV